MPTMRFGETVIPYTVEVRPRRRYAAIQVDSHRQVTILIPPGFPRHQLESLLQQKAQWILKHIQDGRSIGPERRFETGETFMLLGKPLTLEIERRLGWVVERDESRLVVPSYGTAGGDDRERIRGLVTDWMIGQANSILPGRLQYYADRLSKYPRSVKVSEYKSRWGYCREDGLIALNWRIVQAPESVCDYVIIHELTHLQHPHHQSAFWKAVEREVPDYGSLREWLKHHGSELVW